MLPPLSESVEAHLNTKTTKRTVRKLWPFWMQNKSGTQQSDGSTTDILTPSPLILSAVWIQSNYIDGYRNIATSWRVGLCQKNKKTMLGRFCLSLMLITKKMNKSFNYFDSMPNIEL
eukprot:Lithocolla_globosa_v1_NODE_240_length_4926_cov_5.703552.p3 type:complete len:117 gc:universal NODE_240_length_4926_cov_5.703552:2379-2729(+)